MGQYYFILTEKNGSVTLYDRSVEGYGHIFAKLMEHSYINNPFVESLTSMLYDNPMRVIWMGDYSDSDSRIKSKRFLKSFADSITDNTLLDFKKELMAKDWKFEDYSNSHLLYMYVWENDKSKKTTVGKAEFNYDEYSSLYLIDTDRKEYVDMKAYIKSYKDRVANEGKEDRGFIIAPLPLLTAVGNGNGGGDYHGDDEDKVGLWAGDEVYFSSTKPADGFKEIHLNFYIKFL